MDTETLVEKMSKIMQKEEKLLLFIKKKSWRGTLPVVSFPDGASPYGVMDMIGNVFEWCGDWYEKDYYNNALEENPIGPEEREDKSFLKGKVLRGGSWNIGVFSVCKRAYKGYKDILPSEWGFRCVKDIS